MKNGKKLLMVLCAALMLTGCASKDLKNAYNKMSVGDGKNQINGYSLSIRLFGLYNDEKVNQSIRVQNYLGKNYKVVDSSDNEITYYVIDGVNYKSVVNNTESDTTKNESAYNKNTETTTGFDNDKEVTTYEETDKAVPFTDTNLYLTSLKSAKKIGDATEEKIGDLKYTTYEYTVAKKTMLKILADSALKDIKFTADIPTKVWIDEDGYVYKIEYDLATGIKSESTLSLNVYYNAVNDATEITTDELNLSKTNDK
jgi:hypothetical protein